MNRNTVYTILLLTIIWVILCESITIFSVLTGIGISACCVYFYYHFLPFPKISGINFFRLALYPFYLLGQVYLSAFNAIKLILTGANVSTIEVKTQISNALLRTLLANSITLTPCTVSLELNDDTITVLLLSGKVNGRQDTENAVASIKNTLEKMLLKAQK